MVWFTFQIHDSFENDQVIFRGEKFLVSNQPLSPASVARPPHFYWDSGERPLRWVGENLIAWRFYQRVTEPIPVLGTLEEARNSVEAQRWARENGIRLEHVVTWGWTDELRQPLS